MRNRQALLFSSNVCLFKENIFSVVFKLTRVYLNDCWGYPCFCSCSLLYGELGKAYQKSKLHWIRLILNSPYVIPWCCALPLFPSCWRFSFWNKAPVSNSHFFSQRMFWMLVYIFEGDESILKFMCCLIFSKIEKLTLIIFFFPLFCRPNQESQKIFKATCPQDSEQTKAKVSNCVAWLPHSCLISPVSF